jgi:hypothetical protein
MKEEEAKSDVEGRGQASEVQEEIETRDTAQSEETAQDEGGSSQWEELDFGEKQAETVDDVVSTTVSTEVSTEEKKETQLDKAKQKVGQALGFFRTLLSSHKTEKAAETESALEERIETTIQKEEEKTESTKEASGESPKELKAVSTSEQKIEATTQPKLPEEIEELSDEELECLAIEDNKKIALFVQGKGSPPEKEVEKESEKEVWEEISREKVEDNKKVESSKILAVEGEIEEGLDEPIKERQKPMPASASLAGIEKLDSLAGAKPEKNKISQIITNSPKKPGEVEDKQKPALPENQDQKKTDSNTSKPPSGFDEEEDFEWEKEFEIVQSKLSQWDDSDEEEIAGTNGADEPKKENP